MTRTQELKDRVLAHLNLSFRLRTMSGPYKFTGLRIVETEESIKIDQKDYIDQLAADFSVKPSNVREPIKTYKLYTTAELDPSYRVKPIIGSLRYVADRTRPDVAFAVGYLSRFADHPSKLLFDDCLMVLQYLVNTKDMSL